MKVKKKPRRVNHMPTVRVKSDVSITIEQSHARQISELPKEQLAIVIDALLEGTRYDAIAAYFADQGWLRVTEKTFKQYLTAFKRVYPEMLTGGGENSLNGISDPRKPSMDPIQMMEQLVRVQSSRLRQGIDFERTSGFMMPHLNRDIRAHREGLESLAKMRGILVGPGRPGEESQGVTNNVAANATIREVDKNEGAQERLTNAFSKLNDLIHRKKKAGDTVSSTTES